MGFFGLRSLLERLDLSLNACGIHFVRPTSCIQGVLRFVDGTLPALALLAPSGLFLRAFAIATLLLLLESECGLPVGRVVGGSLRMFLRLAARRLAACLLRNELGSIKMLVAFLAMVSSGIFAAHIVDALRTNHHAVGPRDSDRPASR
jgi:hypothetical protein